MREQEGEWEHYYHISLWRVMIDWQVVFSPLVHQKRMQQIMAQCFFAVKPKLDRRLGLFDLIGCDFMVDEDFGVGGTMLNISVVVSMCFNVPVFTPVMSSCAPNRCGCWRWTVIQLSIQTVKCLRRSYPALLWRHWVSSHIFVSFFL